ncbi:MAG: type II secretion system F family protein [Planctomycetes bacterium]|nr:type II secretion system F family protein [Planctomycetota bacterium]
MNLAYQAVDKSGQRVSQMIEAPNVQDAMARLRGEGLFVTQIEETRSGHRMSSAASSGAATGANTKMSLKTQVLFTRQLHILLASGSAIVPALKAIARQFKNPEHIALVNGCVEDLEEGLSLSEALQKYPRVFNTTYTAIVAAGEASAKLPQMLERLALMLTKRKAVANKVLGATAYPALLMVMSGSIVLVMLFFVIPRFGEMFTSLDVPLPGSTKFLLGLADVLTGYWWIFALLPASFAGLVYVAVKTAAGRQWVSDNHTRVPLLGRLASRLIQGSFLRTFGSLVGCRVGVLEALELSRGVTANRSFQLLFDGLDEAVTSGRVMSDTMEESGLFAPFICQAIRTGEESGTIGEALIFSADIMDEENTALIETVTKLIEPAVLIVMGAVVGGVAVSLFMPMFDMTSAIN